MRKHGIGQDTFYRWKRLYGGLGREELQRVRALEKENKRLKRVVADQALNLQLLQDKLGKR
ncbi:MAG: transposase [Gammaproteobacteria bacterium]